MKRDILIFETDPTQYLNLSEILKEKGYCGIQLQAFSHLDQRLSENDWLAVILDLHAESVDTRTIRDLTVKYPEISFLGSTRYRYNPRLKDLICYHIFACMVKPVDPDELLYWLRCIEEENSPVPAPVGSVGVE